MDTLLTDHSLNGLSLKKTNYKERNKTDHTSYRVGGAGQRSYLKWERQEFILMSKSLKNSSSL